MTIIFDWWLLPLLLSIATFGWAIPRRRYEHDRGGHYFPDFTYTFGVIFRSAVAMIVSLFGWLIWALVNWTLVA